MLDINALEAKNANGDITEADVSAMIEEIRHYHGAAAYLASCHAATLESLPRSTSKSSRKRLQNICEISANLLDKIDRPRSNQTIPDAIARCRKAQIDV